MLHEVRTFPRRYPDENQGPAQAPFSPTVAATLESLGEYLAKRTEELMGLDDPDWGATVDAQPLPRGYSDVIS